MSSGMSGCDGNVTMFFGFNGCGVIGCCLLLLLDIATAPTTAPTPTPDPDPVTAAPDTAPTPVPAAPTPPAGVGPMP